MKSLKRDNISYLCFCLKRKKHAKLYLPSTFQTSDIELLSKKIKLNTHLTKSKHDHIYKLGFDINNLYYNAHNKSSVRKLKHFVYSWQMNITAEF